MTELWSIENEIYESGVSPLCGVDEAGRGPLAGPVCAAAVILPRGLVIEGLNDSKKLSEKKRELLYDEIIEKAVSYGIAFATVEEIEEKNILEATFLAIYVIFAGRIEFAERVKEVEPLTYSIAIVMVRLFNVKKF